jgi:hypothetical protein
VRRNAGGRREYQVINTANAVGIWLFLLILWSMGRFSDKPMGLYAEPQSVAAQLPIDFIEIQVESKASREPAGDAASPKTLGQVQLKLVPQVKAYIDSIPGHTAQAHLNGDVVWLGEGMHLINITAEGYPQAVAQFKVRPGFVTLVNAIVVGDGS